MPKVGKVGRGKRHKHKASGPRRAPKARKVTVYLPDGTVEVRTPASFKRERSQAPTKLSEYNRYIRSPEWRALRLLVLERDHHGCTDCGKRSGYLHVHHLTYERFQHEQLEDLTTLCESCHAAVHKAAA